ncbi:unnamed protein product [Orchesella dallaii]|uniref:Mitoferrin-1 n=1 Tax=Orchesella dallaii TaxID=48710 RepID=A0ABP1PY79_9HEXA
MLRKPGDPDYDEYETLPSSSITTHMTAGAIAGIMEHCVMYPLDSVKTRMQSLIPTPGVEYRTVMNTLTHMVRSEGVFRPVRGMSAVIIGAGPAHALYFASYEHVKQVMVGKVPSSYNHFVYGFAGCLATVFHDGVMTPADVVKQRMQMYASPYKSCWDCIRKTYRAEGAIAFYRSYTTQLSMNIPFQSLHFVVYESMQNITNKEKTYNPKAHMVSGAMAGALASAVTTPLDVCKTLLNTQETTTLKTLGKPQITGMMYAIRTVYQIGGIRGYFQGMSARVLYQMPSTAICWSVYEFFKFFITKRESEAESPNHLDDNNSVISRNQSKLY